MEPVPLEGFREPLLDGMGRFVAKQLLRFGYVGLGVPDIAGTEVLIDGTTVLQMRAKRQEPVERDRSSACPGDAGCVSGPALKARNRLVVRWCLACGRRAAARTVSA